MPPSPRPLVAASEELPGLEAWARELAQLAPSVRTVTLLVNRSRANVAVGESERILHGDGTVVERLLGLDFEASSGAFLQTNSRQAEALYAAALSAADLSGAETVLGQVASERPGQRHAEYVRGLIREYEGRFDLAAAYAMQIGADFAGMKAAASAALQHGLENGRLRLAARGADKVAF